MIMLSSVLVDENKPLHVRNVAGLALKNALSARVCHFFPLKPQSSTAYRGLLYYTRIQRGKPTMPVDGFRST